MNGLHRRLSALERCVAGHAPSATHGARWRFPGGVADALGGLLPAAAHTLPAPGVAPLRGSGLHRNGVFYVR